MAYQEDECTIGSFGRVEPTRLWRVGRVNTTNLFIRKDVKPKKDLVVDILIDSSYSQTHKQSHVALQAYIIARALKECEIPCRISGFNCFFDYTVIKHYCDYEDCLEATENIFEFICEGSNRDGLAIKGVCVDLIKRGEENKVLIVLSDGKPNDVHFANGGECLFRGSVSYTGKIGIDDTAHEVRIARRKGISVLGIFTGQQQDLNAEKTIYGKDFIYTKKMFDFSDIIATYLKRVIL